MTINILITGARAPVALELARLFASAGYRVYTADSLPVTPCGASRFVSGSIRLPEPSADPELYIQALKRVVQEWQIELLVPTCEEIYYIARGKPVLEPFCTVFMDDFAKLRVLHNKFEFIERMKGHKFCVPHTELLQSAEEAQRFLDRRNGASVVLKPVYSRFAAKVRIVRGDERVRIVPAEAEVRAGVGTGSGATATRGLYRDKKGLSSSEHPLIDLPLISERYPWVGQQFIEGRQFSTYSIVRNGVVLAHAAYEARFTAGLGACISFEAAQRPELLAWVKRFSEAEQYTGQVAFDFIIAADGGIYPLECNPRATSGVHLYAAKDRLDRAFVSESTATAMAIAESSEIIEPSGSPSMLKLAMLTYGLRTAMTERRKLEWLRLMGRGRDAVFRWNDPKPFGAQFAMLYELWRRSRANGISIVEATTADIEWNGEK